MSNNNIYILNPAYYLKNDVCRSLIGSYDNASREYEHDENFLYVIYPEIAQMLSFFNGDRTLGECIYLISNYFNLSKIDTENILKRYICNLERFTNKYNKMKIFLPRNILVEKKHNTQSNNYAPKEFIIEDELDLLTTRLYKPVDCMIEVTFKCYTNCIYCYADRHLQKDISIELFEKIVLEAKNIGLINIDINGGEILLHKNYKKLLSILAENNYFPIISSKIPIEYEVLNFLKNIGMINIQISIDSINPNTLSKMLNVELSYLNNLLKTLNYLDENAFNWQTNTIITRLNSSINDELEPLLTKLLSYKNNQLINIGTVGYSLYKTADHFNTIKPSAREFNDIIEYIDKNSSFTTQQKNKIQVSGFTEEKDMILPAKILDFHKRSMCSGNQSTFVVLPDGKVTICEELYWHPQFIIGDLSKQTVLQMWNSKEAINMFYLSKEKISTESACYDCSDYYSCRHHKGICWKEVLMAYGNDNWDYPDPGCPNAPQVQRKFFLE